MTKVLGPAGIVYSIVKSKADAIQRAIDAGATDEQIKELLKTGTYAGIANSEPAGKALERLLPGKLPPAVRKAVIKGAQDALYQYWQNKIAKKIYNSKQNSKEGVVRKGATGAITGGLIPGS